MPAPGRPDQSSSGNVNRITSSNFDSHYTRGLTSPTRAVVRAVRRDARMRPRSPGLLFYLLNRLPAIFPLRR